MIVVFGSLNLDLVLTVPALPRPGETVLCPGYVLKPGGKGANQAVAAARAGAEVRLFGRVGDDAFGRQLCQHLAGEGVDIAGVATDAAPTGCAAVCVDGQGENQIVVAGGANLALRADQVPDAVLTPAATVLMQMEVPAAQVQALIARARARGARTVLNLAPAGELPRAVLAELDVLVVNALEAAALAQRFGLTGATPRDHARALAASGPVTCVVTLGGAGALAAEPDGRLWHVPALPVAPVDTTGAGDAFCGVLAASLDAGDALPMALRCASVAAGLACLALGAQESLPGAAAIAARLAEVPEPRRLPDAPV